MGPTGGTSRTVLSSTCTSAARLDDAWIVLTTDATEAGASIPDPIQAERGSRAPPGSARRRALASAYSSSAFSSNALTSARSLTAEDGSRVAPVLAKPWARVPEPCTETPGFDEPLAG